MKLTIYVMTSDKYLDAIPGFCYLFNKYWSDTQSVLICGFSPPKDPLPKNFNFFSIGDMKDYPVDKWTDSLIEVLNHFPLNDVFLLMLEDYWLTKQADLSAIGMLTDYMRQFRNCIKMDTRTDRRFAGDAFREFQNNRCGHIPLVMSNPKSQYHMSLMSGLWNRDAMLSVLHPGETPWEVETSGQTYKNLVSRSETLVVLGTDVPDDYPQTWCPIHHTLAHRRGDPSKYAFDEDVSFGLSKQDINELLELGLIDKERL